MAASEPPIEQSAAASAARMAKLKTVVNMAARVGLGGGEGGKKR
jgi:hypothetical protein